MEFALGNVKYITILIMNVCWDGNSHKICWHQIPSSIVVESVKWTSLSPLFVERENEFDLSLTTSGDLLARFKLWSMLHYIICSWRAGKQTQQFDGGKKKQKKKKQMQIHRWLTNHLKRTSCSEKWTFALQTVDRRLDHFNIYGILDSPVEWLSI